MKKQFDKKRQNLQGLKVGDNMWLKNNSQRSWIIKDMGLLGFQRTLAQKYFN